MTISMDEFSRELNSFANTFTSQVNKLIRLTALEAINNLVLATPVDTGRARGNWFISYNVPINESTENTEWQANLAEQEFKLASPTSSNVIWLVNNLPYIVRLNNGWSGQAPEPFVESSIAAAEKSIGRSVKNIKF